MSDVVQGSAADSLLGWLYAVFKAMFGAQAMAAGDAPAVLGPDAVALLLTHPDGFDEGEDALATPGGREIQSAGLLTVDGGGWGTHQPLSERGKRTFDHYDALTSRRAS